MKKTLLCSSLLGVASLFHVSAFAGVMGSYMFCVNQEDSKVWEWAPASKDGVPGYSDEDKGGSGPSSEALRGTWLNGTGALNGYAHSALDVKYVFENQQDAQNFCKELQNICTSKFGEKFTHVGASSWAIPSSMWGYISVKYKMQDSEGKDVEGVTNSSVCPNWSYSHFPNNGGVLVNPF